MKRWLARIAACLVLGAMTTIAVAWVLAWQLRLDRSATHLDSIQLFSGVNIDTYEAPGARLISRWQIPLRASRTGQQPANTSAESSIWQHVEENQRGWPFVALSCTGRSHQWQSGPRHDVLEAGIYISRDPLDVGNAADHLMIALPLRPMWPGFAYDMLVFACGWLVIVFVRLAIRRRVDAISPRLLAASLIVCSLLGIATTVTVAIILAHTVRPNLAAGVARQFGTDGFTSKSIGRWWLFEYRGPGALHLNSWVFIGGGVSQQGWSPQVDAEELCPWWAGFVRPPEDWLERDGNNYVFAPFTDSDSWQAGSDMMEAWGRRVLEARGWPMLALKGGVQFRQVRRTGGGVSYEPVDVSTAILREQRREDGAFDWENSTIIPLMPIWTGFAVNTLLVAAALWLVSAMLMGIRPFNRGWRIYGGRCPDCGYDLRGQLDAGCSECGWGRVSDKATG